MATNPSYFVSDDGILLDGVWVKNKTIDVQGIDDAIILDEDGDTSLSAASDDRIDVEIAGANDFTFLYRSFSLNSGSSVVADGSTVMHLIPVLAQQDLTDSAGANITTYYTAWTTTGAATSGLADGVKGQLKKITMVAYVGDGVMTPSNLDTYNTITFNTVGDFVVLMFDGTNWLIIEHGNDADGTAVGPTLA